MAAFEDVVEEHWFGYHDSRQILSENGPFSLVADTEMHYGTLVEVLQTATPARILVTVAPGFADDVGLGATTRSLDDVLLALGRAGKVLNGADDLFYFARHERVTLRVETDRPGIRSLGDADAAAFAGFVAHCSEPDLDSAFVALDHWLVVGAFVDEQLVSVASMYPWGNGHFADTGVLTVPSHRGEGHARRVVRAISRQAIARGYEPQYRCQLDNAASIALARSAGLTLFGTWDVVLAD